jgi:hypothetical protein
MKGAVEFLPDLSHEYDERNLWNMEDEGIGG